MENILHLLGFCSDSTLHINLVTLLISNTDIQYIIMYFKTYIRA
jgi:hypothetical protein